MNIFAHSQSFLLPLHDNGRTRAIATIGAWGGNSPNSILLATSHFQVNLRKLGCKSRAAALPPRSISYRAALKRAPSRKSAPHWI